MKMPELRQITPYQATFLAERMVLKTSEPGSLTEAAVADLLTWYNATLPDHPWPIAVGSEFVFRFLACHPFQDDNGRTGRALFLLRLLQCRQSHLHKEKARPHTVS